MQIICPKCQFTREVDETKIPSRSQVATCPKCHTRFRFRELPEEDAPAAASEAEARPGQTRDAAPQPRATQPAPGREQTSDAAVPHPQEDTASKDGLWDRLDRMAPPERKENSRPERPEAPTPDPSASPSSQEPIPGWTGEFNEDFPDPMFSDEDGDAKSEEPVQVPPPFEQLDRYGFFRGLFLTIKLILVSPRLFFSVMPVGGGLAKPLTFTILVTMIQSFAQYLWGLAGISSSVSGDEAALSGMSATMTALAMLLLMPAFITVAQFVLTGVYHVLLILMRGDNRGFEGTFRALVYSNAPIVLGVFPMPNRTIEVAWMTIAAVWGLALTILGLKCIHRTTFAKVVPVALIPLLLGMIAALYLFQGQVATI